jgi:hypothetical protein
LQVAEAALTKLGQLTEPHLRSYADSGQAPPSCAVAAAAASVAAAGCGARAVEAPHPSPPPAAARVPSRP